MDYLLNPRNLKILESFCFAKTLFVFDYEGALGGKAMKASTVELLTRLNAQAPVAVMSSGTVENLRKDLPIEVNYLIGNTGVEGAHSDSDLVKMEAQARKWILGLAEIIPVFEKLGILLEDRKYSLTFRYGDAPNSSVAEAYLQLAISHFRDARISHGKSVLHLLPLNVSDKGVAIEKIMKDNQYKFGVFIGDDGEEEEVFQYQNSRLLTIKVGRNTSLGKLYILGIGEMDTVFTSILSFFSAEEERH